MGVLTYESWSYSQVAHYPVGQTGEQGAVTSTGPEVAWYPVACWRPYRLEAVQWGFLKEVGFESWTLVS